MFFSLSVVSIFFFFFFSSRRRHTRLVSDWSSDVCSSDLAGSWAGLMIRFLRVRCRSWNGWSSGSPDGTDRSDVGVRKARPAPLHPVQELLVKAMVHRR